MTAIEAIRRASGELMFFMENLSLVFDCSLRRKQGRRNFLVPAAICLWDFRAMRSGVAVAVRLRREKHATSRASVGRTAPPCPTRQSALMKLARRSFEDGPPFHDPVMISYRRLCRCSTRLLDQLVKLTSNACAPREEARPSVSPARYMTTPFWFVSFACIFPSIRVSPRLTPW